MLKLASKRWIAVLALLCILTMLRISAISSAVEINIISSHVLYNLHLYATAPISTKNMETHVESGQCVHYLELLTYSRELDQQNPERAYNLLQRAKICQGNQRRSLLLLQEADLLSAQGRKSDTCQVLQSVNAKSLVLEQVERAYQHQDWEAHAFYLNCLQELEAQPGWVSPWLVSEQYARLGRHYELVGQLDNSLAAYIRSAGLYPGVYANPITGQARVLRQQGNLVGAIDALTDGLKRPGGDDVNSFVLLSDLGYLWELEGKPTNAYCTYERALKLLPHLPIEMEPQKLRANLQAGVDRIPQADVLIENECNQLMAIILSPNK